MAVKFLSDGHFSGSSTDLTLDGQLFLPSFSNTPGASPTISFDSGSGGISYRNGGGGSDQLWFRAGGSNMGYVNSAGIHSSGNLYTADGGDFRNYGGEWHATTGVTGNGFKFTNTADSVDALTLSATGNGVFAGNLTVSGTGQSSFGGQVTIPATPVAATDAASKGYVDGFINDTLSEVLANGNTTGSNDIEVTNGNINFEDSTNASKGRAIFGNQSDLSIYHDSNNSYIAEGGIGSLHLLTNTLNIQTFIDTVPTPRETMATFVRDGAVSLYYDNSKKFETTSTGINVTGRISNLTDPSAAQDAATKSYVDSQVGANNDLQEVTDNGASTTNAITTGNITANGSILGGGNLFLRSYNTDPKGIFFRDGFEYGDTNQYNLSITVHDDGDGSADAMNINAYDGIYFNVQSGTTPSTAFRVLNTEVRSYKTLIADSTFQMNDSNTNLVISGNTSGNATIDNNTGSIAFQANGSTVNSMTITSSAITLNENTTVTGTFDPQGNILGAVVDDGNIANPLTVKRSAASTMQVGINFTVSPSSGSGFSRYLGVDSSADLRFGSSTNHGTNALVLTTANYVSQFGSFAGDIIPSADSTYDLGSNANKWAEGHFDHLYVGETGNNPRIDIYTESSNNPIADTFAQDTQKSYIYFNAGSGSSDPGYIMHETTGFPEDNEGVLHLVPSDDNSTGDYVSIHGTNDPDCIKLHTSGLIETANYQLQLRSAVGDVYIDDGLTVNGTIAATGGTSTTWNEAHDNMIISASVSGTSTKTLTLNQNDGGTITASWTDLQGTTMSAPNAPTNLSLSIVNNTVNVTFNASSTSGIDQYLVFGSANGGNYSLISVIEPASMSATMSVIDDSFDDSGAQAYRVYAMKTGVMSSALSGSVTYTVSTPVEPTNMSVVNLNTAFYIQWDQPSSNARFVTAYNVYKHEHASQASLSRSSATLIYSGMNTSYMYEISGNNNLSYHQFWVETTVT